MNNIFKNAYFGKPYKTRDGQKAIYIKDSQYDDGLVCIVYEDIASIHRVMKSGHYWANSNVETDDDIISEWQEPINEEELDRLARKKYPLEDGINDAHWNTHQCELREAFKVGYRKAKGL